MQTYDPDDLPQIDPEIFEKAMEMGLRPLHVICDEPDAKVGDQTGVSFVSFVGFIPRIGDRLELEDGAVCEVKRVYFKLNRVDGVPCLTPNVFAVRLRG